MGAGTLQHRTAEGSEGSRVRCHLCLDTQDLSVLIAAHSKVHDKMMPLRMDQQGFRPGQPNLYRPSGIVGEQRRMMLHRHVLLAAKTAAYQRVFRLDLIGSQHQAAFPVGTVGILVRGNDHHVAVLVDISHRAFRLQERMLRPGRLEMLGNDMLRIPDRFGRISPAHMLVGLDIGLLLVKYLWSVRSGCFLDVMYHRKDLVLHLDQLFRLFHGLHVLRGHQRHGVSQVMGQPAHRDQGVLVMLEMADLVLSRNVLCGQNRCHTGQSFRFGGVDGEHPGSWIFAPKRRAIIHIFLIKIIRVLAVAEHLFFHIQTVYAGTYLPVVRALFRNPAFPQDLCGKLHRGDDLHISGTTAVIVPQGVFDLILSGIRIHVQQCLRAHHHARDTEAALYRSRFPVCIGKYLGFPFA